MSAGIAGAAGLGFVCGWLIVQCAGGRSFSFGPAAFAVTLVGGASLAAVAVAPVTLTATVAGLLAHAAWREQLASAASRT